MLVSKKFNVRGNIHNQFGQCINKGIHSLLPSGTEFKSPKDFYFSSSMCCLAICLELLWIFEIKQAMPIVHNLAWAPLKNCTWSEAFIFIVRRDNFMMYLNGWFSGTNLWFVFSGRHYVSEQVSVSLSSKSRYQEGRQDFPGVPSLLTQFSRNVSPLRLLIMLIRWGYEWMKWQLQSVRKLG